MVAHKLFAEYDGNPKSWPALSSLCGRERRRTWLPLNDFVLPEAFERCPDCAKGAGQ
jgi:hypothetical protein